MKSPNTSLDKNHIPVMLKEVIKICSPKQGDNILDCTFGGGGYSKELLKFSSTNIIAFDRDKEVLPVANLIKKKFQKRFNFHLSKFSNIDKLPERSVDAVIFDLGVPSLQLDNLERGFSVKSKSDLDMDMGLATLSAKEVINNYDGKILRNIIRYLGDEKQASSIAKNILIKRKSKIIKTTDELVDIIKKSKKKVFNQKIDVCTKTFQAIRIFVNKEISELIDGIIKATKILKPGGKLIVISFHSLEDKIVKFYFKNFASNKSKQNKYQPDLNEKNLYLFEKYKNKIFIATQEELNNNRRARSAKLRFVIRNNKKFKEPEELKDKFKYLLELEGKNA